MDAGKVVFDGTPAELIACGEGSGAAGGCAAGAWLQRGAGRGPVRGRPGEPGMTAAAEAPARPAPRVPHAWRRRCRFLRLLRIELRHSAMPWLLPLIAALFWFDSYRPSTGQAPLYVLRTFWNMGQGHTFIDFGPFVASVAAWMASRDGRRHTADLVTGTARPRWVSADRHLGRRRDLGGRGLTWSSPA